jgi:hypothetical protein
MTLFRRLSDDFNLPGAPAHSIHYVAGIRDEVISDGPTHVAIAFLGRAHPNDDHDPADQSLSPF